MASTSYSGSPSMTSGGGSVKLGPCSFVSVYFVRRLTWKTSCIRFAFHCGGMVSWYTTGEMTLVMVNGPYLLGANLALGCVMLMFFPSSQTFCPWVNGTNLEPLRVLTRVWALLIAVLAA